MLADERKKRILEVIGREGRAIASELSREFGVSEDTIRRDLRELSSEGLLHRVHGGALPLPKAPIALSYHTRAEQSPAAKTAIGRAAAAMVRDGQVITIDGGTTPLEVAEHLAIDLRATVITHSLPVLRELANRRATEPPDAELTADKTYVLKIKLTDQPSPLEHSFVAIASGSRMRILRPCTLIMEQKLQLKGQPRPQSIVPNC